MGWFKKRHVCEFRLAHQIFTPPNSVKNCNFTEDRTALIMACGLTTYIWICQGCGQFVRHECYGKEE